MPQYSVAISIVSGSSQERLYKDVRSDNGTEMSWTIAVNPHGNVGSQDPRFRNAQLESGRAW